MDEFDVTIPLAPFSLALSVIDLKKKELKDTSSDMVVRIWSDEKYIAAMSYMNELSLLGFKFFSNYFNDGAKLKKLDVVVHPFDQEGFVGYYGMVTMR